MAGTFTVFTLEWNASVEDVFATKEAAEAARDHFAREQNARSERKQWVQHADGFWHRGHGIGMITVSEWDVYPTFTAWRNEN